MILEQLKNTPEELVFSNVIAYIDEHYEFTPTEFTNGNTVNEANQNNGSCKVFSFAKMNQLSPEETLLLFSEFYREDVLKNPLFTPITIIIKIICVANLMIIHFG